MFSNFEQPGNATESVEQYEFEPIQGYPMLHWKGKRPFRSTQYYPAQLKETYGEPVDGWMNRIYWGDNLQVMSHLLKEFRGKIDLVYIDPPFDSKAEYKKSINVSGKNTSNNQNIFEEKQYTDIWTNDEYLQFMYERLIILRELLSEKGIICLHCDWHKSHHLKCLLEEVFSPNNFINEIVWKRARTVKGNTGQGSRFFGQNTDTIFIFSRNTNYTFNPQFGKYSKEYLDNFYKYTEPETGRRYRLISMTAPGDESKGNPKYEVMGVTRYWRYSPKKMQELIKKGLVVQTNAGNVPQKKLYLDEGQGVPIQSLWDDVDALSAQSAERIGYPTQKPIALLNRIIKTFTNQGNLVLDCFMGSGTTQVSAMSLGRRFIGADINVASIQQTTKRLLHISKEVDQSAVLIDINDNNEIYYTSFSVFNVNHYDLFRNPVQAKDLLIEALEIQPIPYNSVYDGEKDGRMVKIMPVNRIATRADLNELISNFDYKKFEKRKSEQPHKAVEKILLVCMGHEPDIAGVLEKEAGYKLDVEVVDILRDKSKLEFKRDSEAVVVTKKGNIEIQNFYPMNLLQKLSLMKENVEDWRELVESVMIDWDYDGETLRPAMTDIPAKKGLVKGTYPLPKHHGDIRIKITDLLSESWEGGVTNG